MKKLKELPREYFYELEIKFTDKSPRGAAAVLLITLFFNALSTTVAKNSYEELPFIFYFSAFFTIITVVLIAANFILSINFLWQRKNTFYRKIEIASDILLMFSFVPILSTVYLEEGFSFLVVFSPFVLFPIGIILAYSIKNNFIKSILKGNLLKGGSGLLSKEFQKKYFPIIFAIGAICESYQLTVIIWTRFLGEFIGIMFFSFLAIIFTCLLSVLVASDYLLNICISIFPDWGSYYKQDILPLQ